ARLTPLADVLSSFDIGVEAVAPREETIAGALGRALAADIAAPSDHPAVTIALRDGCAVRADVTTDATSYTPLPLSPAPARIEAGEAMSGDAVAVGPSVWIELRAGQAQALAPVPPGDGVLAAGSDATAGTVLKMAGARLRRIDAAVLMALGIERVP